MTRAVLLRAGIFATLVAMTARAQGLLQVPTWIPALGRDRHLRRSSYTPHVNSTFRIVQQGARPVPVQLEEIGDLQGKPGAEEGFSLLFSGPTRASFQQHPRHVVQHPALGQFRLAVFPVGRPHRGRQHYEAIVNR
jgi:hypothetical protein